MVFHGFFILMAAFRGKERQLNSSLRHYYHLAVIQSDFQEERAEDHTTHSTHMCKPL